MRFSPFIRRIGRRRGRLWASFVESFSRLMEPPLSVMQWALSSSQFEDGVPEGGIGDSIGPVLDGELGGEDGASASVPIVDDLKPIVSALT